MRAGAEEGTRLDDLRDVEGGARAAEGARVSTEREIDKLKARIYQLEDALSSFIVWTAQAAGGPITRTEAELLLAKFSCRKERA